MEMRDFLKEYLNELESRLERILNEQRDMFDRAARMIADQIKAGLLNEKRRKAYESKINQLKIMYPVDITTI